MKQSIIEATSIEDTLPICTDSRWSSNNKYLIVVDMLAGSGTVTVEFTPDDCSEVETVVQANTKLWIQHDILKDISESCASTIMVPFRALRLNVSSFSRGVIKLRVVEGGAHGN